MERKQRTSILRAILLIAMSQVGEALAGSVTVYPARHCGGPTWVQGHTAPLPVLPPAGCP